MQPAPAWPNPLAASDFLLSLVAPTVTRDGHLLVSSVNQKVQSGAFLRGARLADGGSVSAEFTVDASTQVRFGLLVSDDLVLPVKRGYWFTVENPSADGASTQRVRLLRYAGGAFNFAAPTTVPLSNLALQTGHRYTLALRRMGEVFTFSINGTDALTLNMVDDTVGEEPFVGVQVGFFGPSREYTIKVQPRGAQMGSGTVNSQVPAGAEVRVIRAGRSGYDLGALGSRNLTVSALVRELRPMLREGSDLREAGTGLLVPAGAGVQAVISGAVSSGMVIGLGETATDATMPQWDGVTLPGRAGTTVNAGDRSIHMIPRPGSGYAYRSKMAFDPAHDVTLEFDASLEQLTGTKGWLGGVLHVYEKGSDANYIGVNINRDITGPTGGQAIMAMYGDERFTNRAPFITPLGVEHQHRIIWDAATGRVLWYMDGAFRMAQPWTARGPIHAWIGSVAQDSTADSSNQSRATFRNVRIVGTPLP